MPSWSEETDRSRRVVLQPEITRAFWSRRRVWHGDEVELWIETSLIPDGTPLRVEVWEDDSAEGSPDDRIAEIPGDHKVEGGACRISYQVRWNEEELGKELRTEGDAYEFYFKVMIERFGLEKRSNLLYVDLHDFRISS